MNKYLLLITLFLLSFAQAEELIEECGNGKGYSIPGRTELSCVNKDCCCCNQKAHVHDIEKTVENMTRIKIDFTLEDNCADRLQISVSNNTQNWKRIGQTNQCKAKENCNFNLTTTKKYRYVKLETEDCSMDWSRIEVDEIQSLPPEALIVLGWMFFLMFVGPFIIFMIPVIMILVLAALILKHLIKKSDSKPRRTRINKHIKDYEFKKRKNRRRGKPKKPGFFG